MGGMFWYKIGLWNKSLDPLGCNVEYVLFISVLSAKYCGWHMTGTQ